MSVWMVRAGAHGESETLALQENIVCLGFGEVPDLSKATTREAVYDICLKAYPHAREGRLRNVMGQLFAFAHRIEVGDTVVLPLKTRAQLAIARVTGPYEYRTDMGDVHHTRAVQWLRDDIPRSAVAQDLLYSLGAFMTVCKIKRNNAEERIHRLLEGKPDSRLAQKGEEEEVEEDVETTDVDVRPDLEQLARDQIMASLRENFKGHELPRRVAALLRADGYVTEVSDPGQTVASISLPVRARWVSRARTFVYRSSPRSPRRTSQSCGRCRAR